MFSVWRSIVHHVGFCLAAMTALRCSFQGAWLHGLWVELLPSVRVLQMAAAMRYERE